MPTQQKNIPEYPETSNGMNILAIETSCDDTAIAILNTTRNTDTGGEKARILANIVHSQISVHAPYGGVFPTLAKREHAKNIMPLLTAALKKARLFTKEEPLLSRKKFSFAHTLLKKEPELLERFLSEIPVIKKPLIDAIAVTYGPGLEPALWVGINFAKALGHAWNIPIIAVNHMEGHLLSAFMRGDIFPVPSLSFPILALLISGGHTELVLMKDWNTYKIIGQTLDDAAGEAFDKVARMLSLPYPGGPEIAALASVANTGKPAKNQQVRLPRPMITRPDFDFSFSGLKTAVLYLLKDFEKDGITLNKNLKANICHEFQQAVIDVLLKKTIAAAKKYNVKNLVIGGGVSANNALRQQFKATIKKEIPDAFFLTPDTRFTGDNAALIALVAYIKKTRGDKKTTNFSKLSASGNVRIDAQKMPAIFLPRA
jgi:N6-L-threonylcarbamoyladenine synthase